MADNGFICNCKQCPHIKECGGCIKRCDFYNCEYNGDNCVCNAWCYRKGWQYPEGHFDIMKIKIPSFKQELPKVIPAVRGAKQGIEGIKWVSIPLVRAVNGSLKVYENVREVYLKGYDDGAELLISGFCKDDFLEKLWDKEQYKNIGEKLYEAGARYVTSPEYSIYYNLPRFSHIRNIWRNMTIGKYFIDCGLEVIPSIGWFSKTDLLNWSEWIEENKPKYVVINHQLLRNGRWWKYELKMLRIFRKQISEGTKIICNGISEERRMVDVVSALRDNFGGVITARIVCASDQGRVIWDNNKSLLSSKSLLQVNSSYCFGMVDTALQKCKL